MRKDPSKRQENRLNAKRLYITYSKVPDSMAPDEVIYHLKRKFLFEDWIVSIEFHEDGTKHFHAIILSDKKYDFRSPKIFDIMHKEKVYPGHCQSIKKLALTISYVCKHDSYITSLRGLRSRLMMSEVELAMELAERDGIDKALILIKVVL